MLRSIVKSTKTSKALPPVSDESNNEITHFQKRPMICLIDLSESVTESLESEGFNCTISSLGSPVEIPNVKERQRHLCLLNSLIPPNLHEYDIIIIDLAESKPVPYNASDHKYASTRLASQLYFSCEFPQTIFDPKPFVSAQIHDEIKEILAKESILIIFADENYVIDYYPVELSNNGWRSKNTVAVDNYSFLPGLTSTNKTGYETTIPSAITGNFGNLLHKYNDKFFYTITFRHPTKWNSEQRVNEKDKNFIPLVMNSSDEIVSFAEMSDSSLLFVFPQLKDKTTFLLDLMQSYLPQMRPNLFPFNTKFIWINEQEYRLPNEAELLTTKESLIHEYHQKMTIAEEKIQQNRLEYQFLHDLLTESGNELVKAVEHYLHWLGFNNVINCDLVYSGQNEEDLQVVLDNGLLVIEVKGIGGTSKDNECSQISKIRYRRIKERQSVDVFALYIVNHQRYQSPLYRLNPPFSKQQIEDAKSDERGLLTTYDLFKLFFAIDKNFITKSDARKSLLEYGLVTFEPSNCIFIGTAQEIYYNGFVGIFILDNETIKLGDELIVNENGIYRQIKVVTLKDHDNDVQMVTQGEIGIEFSDKITIESELWKPLLMNEKS
jgi:hypothetical protein